MSTGTRSDSTPHNATLADEATEFETFESEYTIEGVTQRGLMIDTGALLWLVTLAGLVLTIPLADNSASGTLAALRIAMIALSALAALAMLFVVRRFDDTRTLRTVTVLTFVMMLIQFALSFYGAGALGAFYLAQIVMAIYVAQFLAGATVAVAVATNSVFAGLTVLAHYGEPTTPNVLSQTSLLLPVVWGIAFSIFIFRQDRAQALDQAEQTAFSDSLTNLPNSRMLRRRAKALLNTRNQRIHGRTGLIVLDLDGFRAANVLHGQADGDRLLSAVAGAIRAAAPDDQLVARTGSDEFSVLIGGATTHMLKTSAEHYRRTALAAIDSTATVGEGVDASVGFAISDVGYGSVDGLFRIADSAMYIQKAAGQDPSAARPPRSTGDEAGSAWQAEASGADSGRVPGWLRWSERSVQTRFTSVAWMLSGMGVALSMAMPDAVSHSSATVGVLVTLAFVLGVVRFLTPPANSLGMQLVEVAVANAMLIATIYATGKSASPAVPIVLLILIYIGWFLPLRGVVPISVLTVALTLLSMVVWPAAQPVVSDTVTIYGGILVTVGLVAILYYNHYYVERARELTAHLSTLDARAGTHNRKAFEDRMAIELEKLSYGDRDALAVVMVDLGNLKRIEAEEGRLAADRILHIVALALADASRSEDFVARLGGDEFVVIAPGVDSESVRALAQRLIGAVREAVSSLEASAQKSIRPSAGFSLYGMHGRTTEELVSAAGIALAAARTASRDPNRVSSFVVAL